MGPRLRTTFLLGVLAGLIVALARVLGRSQPSSAAPSALTEPSAALPVATSAARPRTSAATRPEPASAAAPTLFPAETPPAAVDDPATGADVVSAAPTTWRPPVDGACPDGYPVKAKESSKIFHQPGGLSYERTRPDRCYPDAAAAEADGFRAAKR